jgi:HIV Tat-specific factor 1
MDGRFFSGTKVEAYIADGNEKFKKSNNKKLGLEEGDEGDDEGKRLDKFGSWLEEEAKEADA